MTIAYTDQDLVLFEKEWVELGQQICQAVYAKPEIQKSKENLAKNGFLTLEEKSRFIDVSDQTKYEIIYGKYGQPGSEGYKNFSKAWQQWFQAKGVESQKDRSQRSSVDHILFGSTPDPVEFLLHFEEEVSARTKSNN